MLVDIGAMTISPSDNITESVGKSFILECSVDIVTNPLPQNVPSPTFEWLYGPSNASLPSGVIMSDVTNSSNTYTSTLKFFPLRESHAGVYTCQLGGNERLAVNTIVSVNPGKNLSTV